MSGPRLGLVVLLSSLVTLALTLLLLPVGPSLTPDEAARDEAVRRLVEASGGSFDSHIDPDVGHVLLPEVSGRELRGAPLSTNRLGLRERGMARPKPPGRVRVLLLGDSLVFGEGVLSEERHGALLEGWLRERKAADAPEVDVFHVGISSWNLLGECAYLRRSLSLLQPDLVLHVSTSNDLDDAAGVRGFGAMSRFAPARRDALDGRMGADHPRVELGAAVLTPFILGLDHVSRARWSAARAAVAQLIDALEQSGARYHHLYHWTAANALAEAELQLGERASAVPRRMARDRGLWVSDTDPHWNAAGMRQVGELLWLAIRQHDLLPQLALDPWPEVEERAAALAAEAAAEVAAGASLESREAILPVDHLLDLTTQDPGEASHLYGGIRADGTCAREATFVLRPGAATRLQLRGRHLERPELAGMSIAVWVDDELCGELPFEAGTEVEQTFEVPASLHGRPLWAVRLIANDHALDGPGLQRSASFRLDSARGE